LIQVPRYDADRVVSKLIQKCRCVSNGNSFFDWRALGIEAGVCFNAVPANVNFLNGPLMDGQEELQVRQRARPRRNRAEEENAEEERPEDVEGHTARGADQLSAVQQNIRDVADALTGTQRRSYNMIKRKLIEMYGGEENIPEKKKRRFKRHQEICAVKLLFNPKSFTQTVENIFHYSFLVKKAEASLTVRESDKHVEEGITLKAGPIAAAVDSNKRVAPTPRQAIVSLTMADWRKMIEAYDVKESDVPHRTGSKFERVTTRHARREETENEHEYEE